MSHRIGHVVEPTSHVFVDDVEGSLTDLAYCPAKFFISRKRGLVTMELELSAGFIDRFKNLSGCLFRSFFGSSSCFSFMGQSLENHLAAESYRSSSCTRSEVGKPIKFSHTKAILSQRHHLGL